MRYDYGRKFIITMCVKESCGIFQTVWQWKVKTKMSKSENL